MSLTCVQNEYDNSCWYSRCSPDLLFCFADVFLLWLLKYADNCFAYWSPWVSAVDVFEAINKIMRMYSAHLQDKLPYSVKTTPKLEIHSHTLTENMWINLFRPEMSICLLLREVQYLSQWFIARKVSGRYRI